MGEIQNQTNLLHSILKNKTIKSQEAAPDTLTLRVRGLRTGCELSEAKDYL